MTFSNFCNHATEFMILNSDVDVDYRSHNTSMQTLAHKCVKVVITIDFISSKSLEPKTGRTFQSDLI
jgi:hypothetical protein